MTGAVLHFHIRGVIEVKEKLTKIHENKGISPSGYILLPEEYEWMFGTLMALDNENELLRKIVGSQGDLLEFLDSQLHPERYNKKG